MIARVVFGVLLGALAAVALLPWCLLIAGGLGLFAVHWLRGWLLTQQLDPRGALVDLALALADVLLGALLALPHALLVAVLLVRATDAPFVVCVLGGLLSWAVCAGLRHWLAAYQMGRAYARRLALQDEDA